VATVDDKVMTAVEAAIKKNADVSVDDLFNMARGINSSIGKLSKRQFHARYPLQIKRRMKPKKGRRSAAKKKTATRGRKAAATATAAATAAPTSARDSVRDAMLKFASDLAAAEARKDVVRVVASVDRYVDQVLKAAGAAK